MVCEVTGAYEHTAAGEMRAQGTPQRHTDDTHHPTTTSIHPRPAVPSQA